MWRLNLTQGVCQCKRTVLCRKVMSVSCPSLATVSPQKLIYIKFWHFASGYFRYFKSEIYNIWRNGNKSEDTTCLWNLTAQTGPFVYRPKESIYWTVTACRLIHRAPVFTGYCTWKLGCPGQGWVEIAYSTFCQLKLAQRFKAQQ
jgi:hypothetical protein